MARRMVRLLTAALGLAVLVAAAIAVLGSRGEGASAARASDRRIAIALDDFRFDPQRIRATAGELTIVLRNRGRLAHSFRLRKNGRLWIEQPSLGPGESATVTRRIEPGDYRMFDALSNHEQLGMYGTLVVR